MVFQFVGDLPDCRNEGDLSSKYYDPEYKRKHQSSEKRKSHDENTKRRHSNEKHDLHDKERKRSREGIYPRSTEILGPTLPTHQDLQLQKGTPSPQPLSTLG